MNFKQILNAGYVYKSYLQLPNTISKPYKCYSLKTLISYPYYFDNDIMPVLECTCLYTCRYKHNKPSLTKNVIPGQIEGNYINKLKLNNN